MMRQAVLARFAAVSAPLQNGIRFLQPPLPAASTACLAAQLAPERAKHRAYLVPFERHE